MEVLKELEGKVDEEEVKKAETARDELKAAVFSYRSSISCTTFCKACAAFLGFVTTGVNR